MPTPDQNLSWTQCLGRNGWDNPLSIPPTMAQECLNVTLRANQLGSKRPGSASVTLTGTAFTGYNALFRFVPAQDETVAELWIVSQDAPPKMLRVPVAAAIGLTLKDAISGNPSVVTAAALNNKLYLAYQSGVNRLHVYNPAESTTAVRRAGLPAPSALIPGTNILNGGSGTYPATTRWYCALFQRIVGGVVVSQSNLSTPVAFT